MRIYQVWFETSVGPSFSTRQKAINWMESDWDEYDENDPSGYPRIVEIEIDSRLACVTNNYRCEFMDR